MHCIQVATLTGPMKHMVHGCLPGSGCLPKTRYPSFNQPEISTILSCDIKELFFVSLSFVVKEGGDICSRYGCACTCHQIYMYAYLRGHYG